MYFFALVFISFWFFFLYFLLFILVHLCDCGCWWSKWRCFFDLSAVVHSNAFIQRQTDEWKDEKENVFVKMRILFNEMFHCIQWQHECKKEKKKSFYFKFFFLSLSSLYSFWNVTKVRSHLFIFIILMKIKFHWIWND